MYIYLYIFIYYIYIFHENYCFLCYSTLEIKICHLFLFFGKLAYLANLILLKLFPLFIKKKFYSLLCFDCFVQNVHSIHTYIHTYIMYIIINNNNNNLLFILITFFIFSQFMLFNIHAIMLSCYPKQKI